ncbi:MAG: ATP-binding protein, partial [Actinomycetota bacterium]|nr:ATP-binding protein [Actinomycetota bacterium]
MSSDQPAFMGAERRAVVDELLRAFDGVAESGEPRWLSLEAAPGWGKTRLVQELYTRLAERQGER